MPEMQKSDRCMRMPRIVPVTKKSAAINRAEASVCYLLRTEHAASIGILATVSSFPRKRESGNFLKITGAPIEAFGDDGLWYVRIIMRY